MDADPIWGSSGQPPLPVMPSPSEMFWSQFWEFAQTYGVAFVITAFTGGIMFGLALHFIQNVIPMRRAKKEVAEKKRQEEELLKEEREEFAELKVGNSLLRGKMNSKMISALRKSVIYPNKSDRGFDGAMADIEKEREALLSEQKEESTEELSETESDKTPEKEDVEKPLLTSESEDGKQEETTEKEPDLKDSADMLKTLGTLHGKLATAQLRARTRRMHMEMTDAERESEAEMRAKQLESIMKLMMQNKEKFGMSSDDVKEQLNMYNF